MTFCCFCFLQANNQYADIAGELFSGIETILKLFPQWPGLWKAARLQVTSFWYRPHCFCFSNQVVLMLTSWHLNEKSKEVCIKTSSPPASLAVWQQRLVSCSEGLVSSFWYRPHCFCFSNQVVLMLTSWHLNEKSKEVCIKTSSPPASLAVCQQRLVSCSEGLVLFLSGLLAWWLSQW